MNINVGISVELFFKPTWITISVVYLLLCAWLPMAPNELIKSKFKLLYLLSLYAYFKWAKKKWKNMKVRKSKTFVGRKVNLMLINCWNGISVWGNIQLCALGILCRNFDTRLFKGEKLLLLLLLMINHLYLPLLPLFLSYFIF